MAENEKNHYHELMKVVGWFFFDLLLLGYVEDSNTGFSFCLPKGWNWAIYVEVHLLAQIIGSCINICL